MKHEPPNEYFSNRVIPEPNSGCWLWIGPIWNKQGYGRMCGKTAAILGQGCAHRASWEMYRGPIPEGMDVCHKCDVTCCVNPDHLFIGTATDNMRDMLRKGRGPHQTHPGYGPRGEQIAQAKLTAEQVLFIRSSPLSQKKIARLMGLAQGHVSRIRNRVCWAHV